MDRIDITVVFDPNVEKSQLDFEEMNRELKRLFKLCPKFAPQLQYGGSIQHNKRQKFNFSIFGEYLAE